MASIKGLTLEIDGNTTKLSKALFQVNKDSRDLQKELKDVDKLLKFDPKNVELLNKKQVILNDTFSNTSTKLDTLKNASEQAFKQLDKGEITQAQFRTLQTEITKTEQELKKLGNELNKTNLDTVSKKFTDLGSSTEALGKKLAPVSLIAGAMGVAVYKAGTDFQDSMAKIKATYGTIEDADATFVKIEKSIKQFALEGSYAPVQVADAFQKLKLAGYDTEKSIATLPVVLDLARASGGDLVRTSDILTDAMASLGETDARKFADQLTIASQNANTEVLQLGEAIVKEGGNFKILNGGITETNTLLSLLADKGAKGTESATALRNIILSLSAPTDKAGKSIKELGINVQDADGNLLPMIDILQDLNRSLDGMGNVERNKVLTEIFNKNDLAQINGLLAVTTEQYDELTNTITNSSGTAERTATESLDTVNGKIKGISTSLNTAFIDIFKQLEPVIKKVLDFVGDLSTKFAGLSDENKKIIGIIALVVAGIAPLLLVLGKISTLVGIIVPLFGSLGTVLGVILSPIGLVVIAIGGLIAIFVTLYKNNEEFRDGVNEIWNKIKEIFISIIDAIVQEAKLFIKIFQDIWSKYGETITETFKKVWDAIVLVFTGIKDVIVGILQTFIGFFTGDWEKFTDGIKLIFVGLWEAIKGIVLGAWALISGAFDILKTAITDWFLALVDTAKNWGKNLIKGFVDGIKEMWDNLKGTVSNIASSIGNFFTGGGKTNSRSFMPSGIEMNRNSLNSSFKDDYIETVNVTQNIYTSTVDSRLIQKEALRNFNRLKGGFFQ